MSNSSIQDRYFYDVQEARRRGIDEGALSCAAGPWNYDLSQAKSIRYKLVLLLCKLPKEIFITYGYWDEECDEFKRGEDDPVLGTVVAFAELRLPEAKP